MKRKLLKFLTLIGCFSTGIIYGSIGVIAILSFLKLKKGGADENSFFVLLDGFFLGQVLDWIIIVGAMCFIIWRFYEAFADPYKMGTGTKAILLRTGAAFSSVADAFIAFSALQALFSKQKASLTGVPTRQRHMVADLLETGWGRIVLVAVGVIMLITAVVLIFYGLSNRFTETIKARDLARAGIECCTLLLMRAMHRVD